MIWATTRTAVLALALAAGSTLPADPVYVENDGPAVMVVETPVDAGVFFIQVWPGLDKPPTVNLHHRGSIAVDVPKGSTARLEVAKGQELKVRLWATGEKAGSTESLQGSGAGKLAILDYAPQVLGKKLLTLVSNDLPAYAFEWHGPATVTLKPVGEIKAQGEKKSD